MSEKQERQYGAALKEYEKEELNNESHKGKILRTNKCQINCVTRGSDEGQCSNPGGRAFVANIMNKIRNYAEARPHVHVMIKFALYEIRRK